MKTIFAYLLGAATCALYFLGAMFIDVRISEGGMTLGFAFYMIAAILTGALLIWLGANAMGEP